MRFFRWRPKVCAPSEPTAPPAAFQDPCELLAVTANDVARDLHREKVGGRWDEIGALQFAYMRDVAGLHPGMRLLDLGCGCFRGGVQFVPFLEAGNYYGIDGTPSLVDAGFERELPRHGLAGRLGRDRVQVRRDFDATAFGVAFDRILSVSLWTHLPLNAIERCLWEVARVLAPGGTYHTSVFEVPPDAPLFEPFHQSKGDGIVSYRDQDPYHYRPADFELILRKLDIPLQMEWRGDWGHSRNQQMIVFRGRE